MHLSATRNRIIRINLVVTVAAFALSICIVPASFFGMNLPHGLEVRPTLKDGTVTKCGLHSSEEVKEVLRDRSALVSRRLTCTVNMHLVCVLVEDLGSPLARALSVR